MKVRTNRHARLAGRFSLLFWLILGVSLLFTISAHLHNRQAGELLDHFSSPQYTEQEEPVELKIRLGLMFREMRGKGEHERFIHELEACLDGHFQTAEQSIPEVVSRLTGLEACAKLTFKVCKDKLKGTNDAEAAVREVLDETIWSLCDTANAEVEMMLGRHRHQLEMQSNKYRADLAATMGTALKPAKSNAEHLDAWYKERARLDAAGRMIIEGSIFSVTGFSLDIIFVKPLYTTMLAVLGQVAKKLATGTGLAAIIAAADGPLPLGDAIGAVVALGGLGLSSWEFYNARVVLRREFEAGLQSAVRNARKTLWADARKESEAWMKYVSEKDRELACQLEQQIQSLRNGELP